MGYKVIQWATGSIGKTCLKQVIEHPDLELVGVLVHSEKKAGLDAGDIARRGKTGVIATRSVDEIVALDADVVLYLPLNAVGTVKRHDETIKRLLRSGKNVITTVAHTYPRALGDDYAAGFEAAGREGNATLFGTGINPGFVAERLAVMLTTVCTHVDSIEVTEVYDVSPVVSPGFIFDLMGIGRRPESFREVKGVQEVFEHIFREVVGYVGHALNVDYDEVVTDHEFGVADYDLELPVGTVEAGGVVNFRWRWHGMRNGKPFFTIQMLWVADPTLEGWEYSDGWIIRVEGAPGIRLHMEVEDPKDMPDRTKAIQYAVAGPVIRAIPEVVAAPPGILLPPVFAPFTHRM